MIDSHFHIFDQCRFPFVENRSYTPGEAYLESVNQIHAQLDVTHRVFVQPSIYGNDNRCLLNAMKDSHIPAKGIAVADPFTVSDEAIAELVGQNIVGFRFNPVANKEASSMSLSKQLAQWVDRLAGTSLILEMYLSANDLDTVLPVLASAKSPVLLDHYAGFSPQGFSTAALDYVVKSDAYVKCSAAYRCGQVDTSEYNDFVLSLAKHKADRLVWGSDWPHTGGGKERLTRPITEIEPFRSVNLSADIRRLSELLDETQRKNMMANTPMALYQFS